MDQHRSAEADDELRQEQLEDEHDSEPGGIGEFLRAHWISVSVAALVLIAAVAAGIIWWLHARHFEWTDDAFIDSRQFAVSSKVPGCIRDVDVTDNRKVAAGDVLVQIDDRDYRTSLAQSEARLSEAVASVSNAEAQIAAQQAQVIAAEQRQTEAEAALQFARQEFERAEKLVNADHGHASRSAGFDRG
jgi:membrane fusion protein, multidrug efflux system